jgi:hypothetical protein
MHLPFHTIYYTSSLPAFTNLAAHSFVGTLAFKCTIIPHIQTQFIFHSFTHILHTFIIPLHTFTYSIQK